MKLRIKRVFSRTSPNCQYKVQFRVLGFWWVDCETGVDTVSYIPSFATEKGAIEFGVFYAKREKQEATWIKS